MPTYILLIMLAKAVREALGMSGRQFAQRLNSADPANGPGQKICRFTGSAGVPCYAVIR